MADLLLDVILIEQIIFSFEVITYSLHKKVETEGKWLWIATKTALKFTMLFICTYWISMRSHQFVNFLKYKMKLYKAVFPENVSLLSVNNWTEIDRQTW